MIRWYDTFVPGNQYAFNNVIVIGNVKLIMPNRTFEQQTKTQFTSH